MIKITWTAFLLSLSLACGPFGWGDNEITDEGGSNLNRETTGNQDGGVDLAKGDIAVHPVSGRLFWRYADSLVSADPASGVTTTLAGITEPDRLLFGDDITLFISGPGSLSRYDLAGQTVSWSVATDGTPSLYITADLNRLVLGYLEQQAVALDASDGSVINSFNADTGWYTSDLAFSDLDMLDNQTVLITRGTTWSWESGEPSADLFLWNFVEDSLQTVTVPNCAQETLLSSDRRRAFLGPTRCRQSAPVGGRTGSGGGAVDPVSVVDLVNVRFERNLPGFGPVSISSDGRHMVAFMDVELLDESLFLQNDPRPGLIESRYQVMYIDQQSLSFSLHPIGEVLPRYALSPAGNVLVIDYDRIDQEALVEILDLETRAVRPVNGPHVQIDSFAMTRDGGRMFIQNSLVYELSIMASRITAFDFSAEAWGLNLGLDDSVLIIRREFGSSLDLYDLATDTKTLTIVP